MDDDNFIRPPGFKWPDEGRPSLETLAENDRRDPLILYVNPNSRAPIWAQLGFLWTLRHLLRLRLR